MIRFARKMLGAVLGSADLALHFATNGAEALAEAMVAVPDVVLLDIVMPDMNGFEVCRRLRSDPVLAEVPIIMVTALDDRTSRLQGIEAGADDFVTKPFDAMELRARIRSITRLNRYRRLVNERTKRQRAEEAERLKDRFISNVSHELRTPLSIITLLSGNLDTLYDRLDDAKRREMIRDIRSHARLLDELITSVLDISRIESGSITGVDQPIDLAWLAHQEVQTQLPLATKKSQRLELIGAVGVQVMGNLEQLGRIVRNLLNNAIKFTAAQGQILCECVEIQGSSDLGHIWPESEYLGAGWWAALRVTDNGSGIDCNDLAHIFDRFHRGSVASNVPGTGLGLSIARELVRLHNGHIAVSSTVGQGSTFAIYLPLLPGEDHHEPVHIDC